jgi:hypothetical protein
LFIGCCEKLFFFESCKGRDVVRTQLEGLPIRVMGVPQNVVGGWRSESQRNRFLKRTIAVHKLIIEVPSLYEMWILNTEYLIL